MCTSRSCSSSSSCSKIQEITETRAEFELTDHNVSHYICTQSIDKAGNNSSWLLSPVVMLNKPPEISGTPITSINQDQTYTFAPIAVDSDLVDAASLVFSAKNIPAWASFDTKTGALTGTPTNENVDIYRDIQISVKDLYNPAKELPPFDLEVKNVVPTLSIENANAIFEDAEKSIIRSDQNVSSSEEGFGTYSIDTTPTGDDFCHNHGSVEIDPDNGEITYKPALNYHPKTSPCKNRGVRRQKRRKGQFNIHQSVEISPLRFI